MEMSLYIRKDSEGASSFFKVLRKKCHCSESNFIITYIDFQDHWIDNTGGSGEIISGGINKNHVDIEMKSQRGRGCDLEVWVYGKRQN